MQAKTLLVLDDDIDSANIIAKEAEGYGFKVSIIESAVLFVDQVSAINPSHLAIHIEMPELDGTALLADLAQLQCTSSIILSSSFGTPALIAAQLAAIKHRLNVRGVLPRPFNRSFNHVILKNMLTDLVSVDLDLYTSTTDNERQSYVVDEAAIFEAISNNQFLLYYQPVLNLQNGKLVGFEALIRWRHPELGIRLPETFIPFTEKTGQIDPITHQVILMGFAFLAKLKPELTLSINISAKSIKNDHLLEVFNQACQKFGIDPKRVVLELTETATMNNPDEAEYVLSRLRDLGFRLSIDDFGTGYSSMAQLARLPFTELKIDKSFVTTMESSSKSRKVIGSTIALAQSLGLTTVAEGIENSLAAIGLRELGCQFGQGYYFARPMDQDAAFLWMQNWHSQY
ncbi:MAG TPA: EAL domain-containing response regulator [Methylophilus sp.]|uniref:EAL domain-containing response regulator n=1 Tax=Methylophilus sp. TaxID=29541 RepID=UPI002CD6289C|nr:EAL domain-containing response regulator [Methylophilus sp.]HSH87055.1 EAL domain-containing response regulator [Methylophilus sp.]